MYEKVEFQVVSAGGKYRCIYINDHRVTGSKPYVSEGLANMVEGKMKITDLGAALVGTGYRLVKDPVSN